MKISGCVVSKKPISLSRAAKLISRFASVENGSSTAVSLYLQRTSVAFNHLVQFRSKSKNTHAEKESESGKKIMSNSDATEHDAEAPAKKKKKRKSGETEKSGRKKSRADAVDS